MTKPAEVKKDDKSVLKVVVHPGQDPDERTAAAVLSPELASTSVATQWCQKIGGGQLSLSATFQTLKDAAAKVSAGNMSPVEARLLSQATALDVMFAEMSRRAAVNITEYPESFERYMKLALKAQNQSRMTLETLANVKNPPVVYAKQANFANGPQQVNNNSAARAPATEKENTPSKILEQSHEQRMDPGTQGQTSAGHTPMAAMAEGHRSENYSGKSESGA
jgi:hypothetical protein